MTKVIKSGKLDNVIASMEAGKHYIVKMRDVLVNSDRKEQVVKSIKIEEKGYPVTTYNLTVEDNHTFFVGTEKVLNHNTIKLLKDCNYTKEVSESITEKLSNTEAHNYVNYIKYKGELAKSELKEMYPDFVAKKNSRIAQTSDALLKKELEFAPYGELEKIPFDNLTGHHMPSNYYMKEKFNIDIDDSLAFNLEQLTPGVGGRHRRTFTYGFKDRGKELYLNLMPRDALAFDINDIRRILKEDGLYNSESRKALSEYINYYKKMAPGVFKK